MSMMQSVLLFGPPVKSFSTRGTPCLQKVSKHFSRAKKSKSFSRPHLVKCSRNLLPSLSSAASIAKFRHFFKQSVNLKNSSQENMVVTWRVKPVEESHQFFPFAELRVLISSWVEDHLEKWLKNFPERKKDTFLASLTRVVRRAL